MVKNVTFSVMLILTWLLSAAELKAMPKNSICNTVAIYNIDPLIDPIFRAHHLAVAPIIDVLRAIPFGETMKFE
jgi:hypothetical protein